jgi:hypothetical protein
MKSDMSGEDYQRALGCRLQWRAYEIDKQELTNERRTLRGVRMALHEQSVGATNEWYTPKHIFEALGCTFDMDVASPGQAVTPWLPSKSFITEHSLTRPWQGFVWMNPPFGARNGIVPWLERFFDHGNGIALVPDRTSAPWWQNFAARADLVLFVSPKIKFVGADGAPGRSPAQGTSLLAVGQQGCAALQHASVNGLGVLMVPRQKAEPSQQA